MESGVKIDVSMVIHGVQSFTT